jgi:cytochrome c oxidase subunit 3
VTDKHPQLVEPYESLGEQREAATLGMWIFLATEILLFGGLFTIYIVYRFLYPETFQEMSGHLDVWLGTINTVVLLTSSLTVALAVHSIEHGRPRRMLVYLVSTVGLGLAFLGIKGVEYYEEYLNGLVPLAGFDFTYEGAHPDQAELFMGIYFTMTGLHAVHLIAGIGIMGWLAILGWRGRFSEEYFNPVETGGLYWHLVDIIWVFLFPLLYLISPA